MIRNLPAPTQKLMNKIFQFLNKHQVPVGLFIVALLSYGIFIPWFGLYGDDWIYLWNYELFGAGSFVDFVAADRPFSAWLYVLSTALFGETVWLYHIFLFVLRWLSAVLFWWILTILWPKKKHQVSWAALLFAVYPGFAQQPIAVQFILHFSILDLFFLSIATMLLSVRNPKKFWTLTITSVLCSISIFSLEYFIGLELLRPVMLWMILRDQNADFGKRLWLTFRYWLPTLIVLIAFAVWRVFIFSFPTYGPSFLYELRDSPGTAIRQLLKRIAVDLKTVSFGAWRQTLKPPEGTTELIAYAILVLSSLVFVIVFLKLQARSNPKEEQQDNVFKIDRWPLNGLVLGVFSLLIAGWPFWITWLPLDMRFPWDRAALPFMVGVSILIASGIDLLIRQRFQAYFIGLLVCLAVGFHYQNALVYRDEWRELQNYFWQLAWRAPDLEEGTVIISDDIPLFRFSDNDLTPLLNWIYAPEHSSAKLPYKYFDLSTREKPILPGLEKGLRIAHSYRNTTFESSTSEVLAIYYQPSSCLRVLGPEDIISENPPWRLEEAQVLSDLDQILVNASEEAQPPAVLGSEPEHGWCYYFEKADLASQQQDWKTVVSLGNEAFGKDFAPSNSIELLPFILGFSHQKDWETAERLSKEMSSEEVYLQPLCSVWEQLYRSMEFSPEEKDIINAVQERIGCVD